MASSFSNRPPTFSSIILRFGEFELALVEPVLEIGDPTFQVVALAAQLFVFVLEFMDTLYSAQNPLFQNLQAVVVHLFAQSPVKGLRSTST
jgi:hypothetical protein